MQYKIRVTCFDVSKMYIQVNVTVTVTVVDVLQMLVYCQLFLFTQIRLYIYTHTCVLVHYNHKNKPVKAVVCSTTSYGLGVQLPTARGLERVKYFNQKLTILYKYKLNSS